MSFGGLLAQYLQLHAVWSLQDAALIPPLNNLVASQSPSSGPYMSKYNKLK